MGLSVMTSRTLGRLLGISVAAAFLVLLFVCPAGARPWKTTPKDLAQDYAQIVDDRGHGDLVLVIWLVPQLAEPNSPERRLLEKYLLVGVVRAQFSQEGTVKFDPIESLTAADGQGIFLKAIKEDSTPPSVAAALGAIKAVFRQALGAMGKGITWFAFEPGSVRACSKGKLVIPLAGETYFYDTPIPGCPSA